MNLEIADYAFLRLKGDAVSSLPELVESVFALADVKQEVRVLGAEASGCREQKLSAFQWRVRTDRGVPQSADRRWRIWRVSKLLADSNVPDIDPNLSVNIDNSLLEKEEEVTIEWAASGQTYDVRARKDLGNDQHGEDEAGSVERACIHAVAAAVAGFEDGNSWGTRGGNG